MINGLKFIKETSWPEVFAVWKSGEGSDPHWHKVAFEHGFASWDDFRDHQAKQFDSENRVWAVYEIEEPNKVIPDFLLGPFRNWQKHFEEKNVHSFDDLVRAVPEWVANNAGIQARMNNFPEKTQFIGVYLKDEDKIVLLEGHHRCGAITLAVHNSNSLKLTENPTIALTILNKEDRKLLDVALEKGSINPNKNVAT